MGVPVWSHHGIVCTGEAYTKVVKLTFARGASIPDPSRLFNSSLEGNTRRAIDIHEGEKVDAGAFKALVKAAVAQNGPPAIERLYAAGKPVAAVCHGPSVLRHAKAPDGTPLVRGKAVTGFANSEEAAGASPMSSPSSWRMCSRRAAPDTRRRTTGRPTPSWTGT